MLVTAVVGRRGPWVGLGFVLLLTGGLAAAAGLTWPKARLWLNIAALAALVILLYTTMTLQGFLSAEKERRRTRAMFGRYVSPAVMEELLKNPDLSCSWRATQGSNHSVCGYQGVYLLQREQATGRSGGQAEYLPE